MPTISRRGFLLGGFPRFAPAQDTITVEEFRALSARLAGASPTDLNASAAAKLLDGFLSIGRGVELTSLAADPGAKSGPLADEIVAALILRAAKKVKVH